jgi:multisubunit Na+/H+ antiporter MnhG subunit
MQLDIRIPIGALFTMLGIILAAYGLVESSETYRRALGHNVNLSWGVVLLAFGLLFLYLARRGTRATGTAA